jgi:hypothetical protein
VCSIHLPRQQRIDPFGFLHRLGTRLAEELLVTESGEKLSRPDRIRHVSELPVNA